MTHPYCLKCCLSERFNTRVDTRSACKQNHFMCHCMALTNNRCRVFVIVVAVWMELFFMKKKTQQQDILAAIVVILWNEWGFKRLSLFLYLWIIIQCYSIFTFFYNAKKYHLMHECVLQYGCWIACHAFPFGWYRDICCVCTYWILMHTISFMFTFVVEKWFFIFLAFDCIQTLHKCFWFSFNCFNYPANTHT